MSTCSKTIKTVLNQDFRRFVLDSQSFDRLKVCIRSAYGESLPESFCVKYQDDEGELCTIGSDAELLEAFSVAEKEKKSALKLFVIPASTGVSMDVESSLPKDDAKMKDEEIKKEETKEKSGASLDRISRILQELFQDVKARTGLQEAITFAVGSFESSPSVQELVKAAVNSSAYLKGNALVKELLVNLSTVPSLVNEKFTALKANPGAVAMIKMWGAYVASNLQMLASFLPMLLLALGDLTSGGFGPGFGGPGFGPMGFGPCGPGFGPRGFGGPHMPPPPHMPPHMFHPHPHVPPHMPPYGMQACESSDEHEGVQCDGCQITPISGPRFKCSVCANYDLCQNCEAKGLHPSDHALVKMRAPDRSAGRCGRRWSRRGRHGPGRGRSQSPHSPQVSESQSEGSQGFGRPGHHGHGPHGYHGHGRHGFGGRGGWGGRFHSWATMLGGGPQCHNWRGEHGSEKLKARLVENVTIPERSVVEPSQSLVKTWKVNNAGSVDWPEGTKLIFVRGDRSISSEEEFPVPPCKAGETVEISALVVSPAVNGRHTAIYRLADAERNPFGPRFWCDFVVGDLVKAPEGKSELKSEIPSGSSAPSPSSAPSAPSAPIVATPIVATPIVAPSPTELLKTKYAVEFQALTGMGFADEDLILKLLVSNDGNVQTVCETLLNSMLQ